MKQTSPTLPKVRASQIDMVRVTLELLVEENVLQQALDEHDPEAPVSAFEERVWLEEALDEVLQSGKFSIRQIILADQIP